LWTFTAPKNILFSNWMVPSHFTRRSSVILIGRGSQYLQDVGLRGLCAFTKWRKYEELDSCTAGAFCIKSVTPPKTPLTGGGALKNNTLLTGEVARLLFFVPFSLTEKEELKNTPLTTSPLQGEAKNNLHLTGEGLKVLFLFLPYLQGEARVGLVGYF